MAGISRVEKLDKKDDLILALNSGSSSLKFGVYSRGASDEEPLLTGTADNVGRSNGTLRILSRDGAPLVTRESLSESQSDALATLAAEIQQQIHAAPVAIGHRIVHGGPNLLTHQLITPRLITGLRAATHFAPLHIPQALSLIASAESNFPSAAQFACFDDAFHQTMPEVASHLPIPKRYFDAGIRRYGFHGLSYESLVHHFGPQLPQRAIFAHLGNGASLCAVHNEKLNAEELEDFLNHQSGLFALSGGESDVKALDKRAQANDSRAKFALDAFAVAIRKVIGAYIALLGGVDLLVFTGGIGEHSEYVRAAAATGLEFLGLTTDKIQIVSAREELQIARHCRRMMLAGAPSPRR